ncbi:hypothetical protein A0H81_04937 [Grifola frondosa]|uniref:Uncharacterized protein n=1 Tax=Grifola frondosa TaxID=5627 RepID=A0A1C7MHU8_GRIFR|nr:hypothetical protein A0H81_04937 [Grifola frondosa]
MTYTSRLLLPYEANDPWLCASGLSIAVNSSLPTRVFVMSSFLSSLCLRTWRTSASTNDSANIQDERTFETTYPAVEMLSPIDMEWMRQFDSVSPLNQYYPILSETLSPIDMEMRHLYTPPKIAPLEASPRSDYTPSPAGYYQRFPIPGYPSHSDIGSATLPLTAMLPYDSSTTDDPGGSALSHQTSPVPAPQRVRVPQTIEATHKRGALCEVKFEGRRALGLRVRDVLKSRTSIKDSEERVLASTGARQIRLVIAWPGYAHFGTYIPIQDKEGFITRGKFAHLICFHLARFMDKATKMRVAQGSDEWMIGKRGILIEDLWLMSIAPAQQNIWLAELQVRI